MEVAALCDVDLHAPHTQEAQQLHPRAPRVRDFRQLFDTTAPQFDAAVIREAVDKVDGVLDIVRRDSVALDEEVERMIQARIDARKARNFAEADRLRNTRQEMGIILEDTPGRTRWRRK